MSIYCKKTKQLIFHNKMNDGMTFDFYTVRPKLTPYAFIRQRVSLLAHA